MFQSEPGRGQKARHIAAQPDFSVEMTRRLFGERQAYLEGVVTEDAIKNGEGLTF